MTSAGSSTPGRRTPRRTALRGAAAALVVAGLLAGALPSGNAAAAVAAAPGRAVTPSMPRALQPGTYTKPVFPEISVPAYFAPSRTKARVKAGSGGLDVAFRVPTLPGSSSVWGDWDGNGTTTPGTFTNGHWALYDAVIGRHPQPTRQLDFGVPGDRPVAGDWNGDGKTDIGVVRGNVWFLSLGTVPAGPPGTPQRGFRSFTWGAPTDQFVVGDWNGDRVDGIGALRAGTWYLRQTPAAGPTTTTFAFGVPKITKKKVKVKGKKKKVTTTTVTSTYRAGDVAVVGDWNSDKKDTIGVVRGSTWYLRDTNDAGDHLPTRTQVATRPTGGVPAPWRTFAGPTGAACPTARRSVPNLTRYVVPSKILGKSLPHVGVAEPGFSVRNALLQSERYVVGAHYQANWAGARFEPFTDVRATFNREEYAVRLPAMTALTAAVAVATKGHVDATVGRTREDVTRYADWLIRSISCQHASVTPGGWAGGFQTAHWATMTGEAAWLIWDQLTPQTRAYVAAMVVSEANFRLTQPAGYWTDRAGTVRPGLAGNTQAEENSWNSSVLELAVSMMPTLPLASRYRTKAIELEVASFSTRADLANGATVNGVPVAQRLQGSNALDDGTVINHSRLHPDYMTNIQHLWWAADLAGLAGRATPRAAFHNAALVYDSMSLLSFTAGATSPAGGVYQPPGGTIYRPGTNDVYYPEGSDWGVVRRAPFMSFDAHAVAYGAGFGPRSPAAWDATAALVAHTQGQLALVASSGAGDGRSYSADPAVAATQDTYPGREEYAAQQVATAWLALYVARNARLAVDDRAYPLPSATTFGKGYLRGRPGGDPGSSSSLRETRTP